MTAGRPAGPATLDQIRRNGEVAAVLRDAMRRLGVSQSEVARRLGMASSGAVSTWVNGKVAPGPKSRLELARVLGVSPAALMPREGGGMERVTEVEVASGPVVLEPRGRRPRVVTDEPGPALSFTVGLDGSARIRLDVTLPVGQAMPLIRMLMDQGLVSEAG